MIRAYYKDNPQVYKDFEDFLFLFPYRRRIDFDFPSDTIWIDGTAFQLSKIQFIPDNSEELDARYERTDNKNIPNGYAGLDENAKIPSELLPTIRVVDVHVVNNSRDLATLLDVDEGDLAVVVNDSKTFVWSGSQWIEILFSESVKSVDGRTGAVTLTDLYATKDHEHRKLVGNPIEKITLDIVDQGTWGLTATNFKSIFTPQNDLQFNQFVLRYPQEVNDFDVEIKLEGQTIYSGNPSKIEEERIGIVLYKVITLTQIIEVQAGTEISLEITFPSEVTLNMVKSAGYQYITYHNFPNYTNPLSDVILFSELRISTNELVELKDGKLLINTSSGHIDDVIEKINNLETQLTNLQSVINEMNDKVSALWAKFDNAESASLRFMDNDSNLIEIEIEEGLLLGLKINGTDATT